MEDPVLASGRLIAVPAENREIVRDVMTKLDIKGSDTVLDIGSGIGQLAIPLSYSVESVTCIDHADVLDRLSRSHTQKNIRYFAGDFLGMDVPGRYSKILIYDVVHYLASQEEVLRFVNKALGLLAPHGKMLIGGVRNEDLRIRISRTEKGQAFFAERMKLLWTYQTEQDRADSSVEQDADIVEMRDRDVLEVVALARFHGHNAYILPQPPTLPLWNQREDIVIEHLPFVPDKLLFLAVDSNNQPRIFSIRHAVPQDSPFVYALSQEPTARAASIRTEAFTFEDHQKWWAERMAEPQNCRMYIVDEENRSLGIVRYGRVVAGRPLWSGGPIAQGDGTEAEVSIVLRPEVRGRKLSEFALGETRKQAVKEMGLTKTTALIRPDHPMSIRAFEKAGYKRVGEEERMGVSLLRYEMT